MKLKRFLSMTLAGVLCAGMLAGCGGTKDTTPVVMTVDGEEVQSSELAAYIVYNMMYYQNSFGMDMAQMADPTIFESIKDGCKNQVVQYRAIEKLAEQEGVTLSKESKELIDENRDKNREIMGSETGTFTRWLKYSVKGDEDPMETYLHSYGYTEELYEDNTVTMALMDDTINKYYEDGAIKEIFDKDYLHAKSILIADSDTEGNALTGAKLEEAKNLAQSILDQVKADPTQFDKLWKEHTSDTAQKDDGYYFKEGDMVEEYYNAVKDMEVGTVSNELVYYEGYGWFIIERLEMKDEAITDPKCYLNNSGQEGDDSSIKDAIGGDMFYEKLETIMEDMEVETNEEYDKITAYNVNAYLPFTTEAFVAGSGSAAGSAK